MVELAVERKPARLICEVVETTPAETAVNGQAKFVKPESLVSHEVLIELEAMVCTRPFEPV
jgi:hypothetical protein